MKTLLPHFPKLPWTFRTMVPLPMVFLLLAWLPRQSAAADPIQPLPDAIHPDLNDETLTVAVQADGKMLVGGIFSTVQKKKQPYLARINTDGTLDTSFNPKVDGVVNQIVLQPDGKILIVGAFQTINSTLHQGIARLNDDGTPDSTFAGNLGNTGYSASLRGDGKIYVGGFGIFDRLNSDGTLDSTFPHTNPTGIVHEILELPDNSIVVGGTFAGIAGASQPYLAHLSSSGANDTSFHPLVDGPVFSLVRQSTGRIVVGGLFSEIDGYRRVLIARLNGNGSVDTSFNVLSTPHGSDLNGVQDLFLLPSDQILVAGSISINAAGATNRQFIARLTANGTLDPGFNANVNERVNEIAVQSDDRIFVGGLFTAVNSTRRNYAARLVDPVPVTDASFTSSSGTVAETAGSTTLTVTLPTPVNAPFILPLSFSGTASSVSDYTKPAQPLVFAPGETTKDIVISLKDDPQVESDETIVVTLGTPSDPAVGKGTPSVFTLTLTSDEVAPVITLDPNSQIVAAGDPVSFNSAATGNPAPVLQWRKNGVNLKGATAATHSIASAKTSDAGGYSMKATVTNVSAISATADLAVVDTATSTLAAPTTGTVSFSVKAAGKGLSYQWFQGVTALANDGHFAGTTTAKLTIKNLTLADSASYSCLVNAPGGSLSGGLNTLVVYDSVPELGMPAFPAAMVSENFSYPVPFNADPLKTPTKFVITGLPPGLKYDSKTGVVSGRPTVPGTYDKIKIIASNGKGSGVPVTTSMTVVDLPAGTVATYTGLMDKQAVVNDGLGGRIDFTTTKTGSLSGKLKLGKSTLSFRGVLDTAAAGGDPTATITIPRRGLASVLITLALHPVTHLVDGTVMLDGGIDTAPLTGWANTWNPKTAPPNDRLGYHTLVTVLQPANTGDSAIPQGCGYASITVKTNGTLVLSGKNSDNSVVATSTILGPSGELFMHQTLYANTGAIQGILTIAADAAHTITGNLDWHKLSQTSSKVRDYKAGFGPLTIPAMGGLYVAPASSDPVMGLASIPDNAQLQFSEGGIGASAVSPDVVFTITKSAVGSMPTFASGNNPGKVTFSVNRAKGTFSGKFVLLDSISISPPKSWTRTVTFNGMIYPNGGGFSACGYFMLPQLPDPMALPPTTTSTSPILSGRVDLLPH